MTRILVVDDEPQIRKALSLNLKARGYEVIVASTGEQALQTVATEHPDLVLLDLGLPGMDGTSVIAGLRGWTDVPIIVVTVRDDERSKVEVLDAGADDYITKPFGMAELMARLRTQLRRTRSTGPEEPEISTTSFRLDLSAHQAFGPPNGEEVRLTPTEWGIIEHLVVHPHRLVTYRQLVTAVWGATSDPDPNLLRVHMANIRRKLELDPSNPTHFVTDAGIGYRFEPVA